MERLLTVGYISDSDPRDKRSWSGIHYQMIKALEEQGFTVIPLGPVKLGKRTTKVLNLVMHYRNRIHQFLYNKKYNREHSHLVSYFHGRFFKKKIKEHTIDVIFAPVASCQIAHLKTRIPICYFSDATVAVMLDYYEFFSGFSELSMKESNEIEQKAISNATTQVFSSKWAYDSAVSDYHAKKPFIVKMGANIESTPPLEDTIKNYDNTIELLFIGVDWKRKGGDIAYETLEKLDQKGYDVRLTIVGCVPPKAHPKMKVFPFLNKNIDEDRLVFEKLLKGSHLFFLPTRAGCFGNSFCEANAYGIPVISTDTGGVSFVVEEDMNGCLLPLAATSEDYCNLIESLILDKEKIKGLAITSREKYNEELNWSKWGIKMKEILLYTHATSLPVKNKQ
jgi:glycosyltransferase involved in cell wall biosynthesis